jgi:hypothetical protein
MDGCERVAPGLSPGSGSDLEVTSSVATVPLDVILESF